MKNSAERVALVFDFGGPMSPTPFELAQTADSPIMRSLLAGRGPFAAPGEVDIAWQELQAGRITERTYWHDMADRWRLAGGGIGLNALLAELYEPPRPELLRLEAVELAREARAAGIPVAILSNDLNAFHGADWVEQMNIEREVDLIIDGSIEGVLKPDPRLYELAAERLGVPLAGFVFLDDQATNIRGAESLGIPAIWFDVRHPSAGYAAARRLLGLSDPPAD